MVRRPRAGWSAGALLAATTRGSRRLACVPRPCAAAARPGLHGLCHLHPVRVTADSPLTDSGSIGDQFRVPVKGAGTGVGGEGQRRRWASRSARAWTTGSNEEEGRSLRVRLAARTGGRGVRRTARHHQPDRSGRRLFLSSVVEGMGVLATSKGWGRRSAGHRPGGCPLRHGGCYPRAHDRPPAGHATRRARDHRPAATGGTRGRADDC